MRFLISLLVLASVAHADTFESEAKMLAEKLRTGLVKQLSEKISEKGTAEAVSFCHENVGTIAKGAAGDLVQRYDFGRTSHKWRNEKNTPAGWMAQYLEKFQGKLKSEVKEGSFVHKLADGKRVYLEPLYVQPLCLQCHGESLRPEVQAKVTKLYPQDRATGFRLNEFRGFIWVKEK